VREMIKRGWIVASSNIEVLEGQFLRFFGLKSLDDEVQFSHAAKKTAAHTPVSQLQLAWLLRARQLATEAVCKSFSEAALRAALPSLSAVLSAPEESRHVARILADVGVRFVVVEPIPGSKIDGACFWLSRDKPVIALSLRLDRIDNFWFVLRHEIEHVLRRHGEASYMLDQDIECGEQLDEDEQVANDAAADFCVPQGEFTGFIARVAPFFAEERVVLFAQRLNLHPGLVAGQLQRRLKRYDLFRKHQVKIRQFVTSSARTDGWGVVTTGAL
jgi:HTH-type transcriptional regulator/antitoxin HigA